MNRKATARWTGDLKTGNGNVKLGSGAFDGSYTFGTRFENASGTNPEELIGAAHASCFSMALSNALHTAGHSARSIETDATVHLEKGEQGMGISRIELVTTGDVPGIDQAEFERFAEATRSGCIVSRALSAVPMTVEARLAGS